MKKFLIISAVFIVLVLGFVAQHHRVDQQEAQVAPNIVENMQPRLTKSEKIAQKYQVDQDPIAEIPVIFEQIVTPEHVKSIEKSPVVALQPQSKSSNSSPKTDTIMHESMNMLAGQFAGQEMPNGSVAQSSHDMGMYPYDMMPAQLHQQPKATKTFGQTNPQEMYQDQVDLSAQDEPQSSRRFKKSHHVSPDSYVPARSNVVTTELAPAQQTKVEMPVGSKAQPVGQRSLLGRVKNSFSKIPKWLYGLPLVAGAYAMMKKAPELEVAAEPESEKVDLADKVHDQLQELQDEHLKQQAESDHQPKSTSEAPRSIVESVHLPVQEAPLQVASVPAQEDIALEAATQQIAVQDAPISIEPSAPSVGGMLSSTKKLLSPVRSMDQLPDPVVEIAVVPVTCTAQAVPSGQSLMRKTFSDCYGYFAKHLSSPIGLLALASKVAVIGTQVVPLVYALRAGHHAQTEDMMLDAAVAQVASSIKPLELSMTTATAMPLDGTISSYVSQLAGGNVSIIAGQLAAQCSTLKIH